MNLKENICNMILDRCEQGDYRPRFNSVLGDAGISTLVEQWRSYGLILDIDLCQEEHEELPPQIDTDCPCCHGTGLDITVNPQLQSFGFLIREIPFFGLTHKPGDQPIPEIIFTEKGWALTEDQPKEKKMSNEPRLVSTTVTPANEIVFNALAEGAKLSAANGIIDLLEKALHLVAAHFKLDIPRNFVQGPARELLRFLLPIAVYYMTNTEIAKKFLGDEKAAIVNAACVLAMTAVSAQLGSIVLGGLLPLITQYMEINQNSFKNYTQAG